VLQRVLRNVAIAALLVVSALLVGAAPVSATIVTNGDFETGTLKPWETAAQPGGFGEWSTYSRHEFEIGGEEIAPAAPPSGEWAAVGANPSGATNTLYLYQDVPLPTASTDRLSMYLYYRSKAPIAVPKPDTLFVTELLAAQPNQQLRVDVLKANAPIESLSPNDILATVYASKSGDPQVLAPTLLSADLSAFAGQTVRLRIVSAVQQGPMWVGVDGVAIESSPLAATPLPPQPAETPAPSNAFAVGKLTLNRRHGGGRLTVTVPDAGTLTVADARRKVAIASRHSDARERPPMIRTATVQTGGAQTVRVTLRPTPAAKKRLARNGKLRFRLQLTFTPVGGMAASKGYAGTLRKTLRPARR
jgi:hypothetical protein